MATEEHWLPQTAVDRFYPRHPRGWRPIDLETYSPQDIVSIHATLAGGDVLLRDAEREEIMFLSTPPSRVATCALLHVIPDVHVSIHATLAGGDYSDDYQFERVWAFLSTPPSRVATRAEAQHRSGHRVSIHATLAGGDAPGSEQIRAHNEVSIHATLAGGDPPRAEAQHRSWHRFLSTPPSRVATASAYSPRWPRSSFYPRHPRGWRLLRNGGDMADAHVSIHATLAGGDIA